MKNTVFIVILFIMLSCNKKAEDIDVDTSKPEELKTLIDTIPKKKTVKMDSISKENSKKEIEISSDTSSIKNLDALTISKQLNGVWNVVDIGFGINKSDNIVKIIYIFDDEKKSIEVYGVGRYYGDYFYKILNTNCENNKKSLDSFFIQLSGDGNYCSEILDIKHKNNKTYLILKEPITESEDKVFIKTSDDPKVFPKEYD